MSIGGFIVPKEWRKILLAEYARMRRKTLPLDGWVLEEVFFWLEKIWKFFFGRKYVKPSYRELPWWQKPPEHPNCRCIMLTEEEMHFVSKCDVRTEDLKPFRENTYQSLLRYLSERRRIMAWTMVRATDPQVSKLGEGKFRLCHECGKKIELDKPPYIVADARDGAWIFHPDCGWKHQSRYLRRQRTIVAELKKFRDECKRKEGGKS